MKYSAKQFHSELKEADRTKLGFKKNYKAKAILGDILKAYNGFTEGEYSIGELLRMKGKLVVLLEMVDSEAQKLGGFRK